MKVLVLGASGMLGSALLRTLSGYFNYDVIGTSRSNSISRYLPANLEGRVICGVDANDLDSMLSVFDQFRPSVVINCIGVVKQVVEANNPLVVLPINSIFPHRLKGCCALINARLIQISTDCVFSGIKGNYSESDIPDSSDLYGMSKSIGEVCVGNVVTIRTSIIGHELSSNHSLVNWFLSSNSKVNGYTQAYFSGLTTFELSKVIGKFVIPDDSLRGLLHVASRRISKFDLLSKISKIYGHNIEIVASEAVRIDRSLNSQKFESLTGYRCPDWDELIAEMYSDENSRRNQLCEHHPF